MFCMSSSVAIQQNTGSNYATLRQNFDLNSNNGATVYFINIFWVNKHLSSVTYLNNQIVKKLIKNENLHEITN